MRLTLAAKCSMNRPLNLDPYEYRFGLFLTKYCTQRIYITLRTDSPPPPLRLPEESLSQPLSACNDGSYTDGQVVKYTADRAERGCESASSKRGAVRSMSDIYSLLVPMPLHIVGHS